MTTLTLNRLRNALLVALPAVLVPMHYQTPAISALWAAACFAAALFAHVCRVRGPQLPPHARHPALTLDEFATRRPFMHALLWGCSLGAFGNLTLMIVFARRLLN